MTPMRTLKQLMDLSGRAALVTGGAGHIGFAIAEALAEQGAAVALLDLPGRGGEAVGRVAEAWKVTTMALETDLADTAGLKEVPGRAAEALGGLDILVHCAALVGTSDLSGWAVPFERQSLDSWRKAFQINLEAPFVLTQAAIPYLRRRRKGSIITVASIYGLSGPDWRLYEGTALGNPAAYAASKGGLIQFTRWLATTLAPDIRANTITPGGVYRQTPEPFHTRYVQRTPLGRMGIEEDFKGAAAYLASDLSAYVTGQNLVVDGGWTAW